MDLIPGASFSGSLIKSCHRAVNLFGAKKPGILSPLDFPFSAHIFGKSQSLQAQSCRGLSSSFILRSLRLRKRLFKKNTIFIIILTRKPAVEKKNF
jgi:hypothetical protein